MEVEGAKIAKGGDSAPLPFPLSHQVKSTKLAPSSACSRSKSFSSPNSQRNIMILDEICAAPIIRKKEKWVSCFPDPSRYFLPPGNLCLEMNHG